MLETITEKSFDAFAQTQASYLNHMRALGKKFKKISKLAKKNNDVMTLVYAEEAFTNLLTGSKKQFMSNNKKLKKSLAKLQTLTEPYTIEEYEGERFKITEIEEDLYLFVDKREGIVVELNLDMDGNVKGFVSIDPDMFFDYEDEE